MWVKLDFCEGDFEDEGAGLEAVFGFVENADGRGEGLVQGAIPVFGKGGAALDVVSLGGDFGPLAFFPELGPQEGGAD